MPVCRSSGRSELKRVMGERGSHGLHRFGAHREKDCSGENYAPSHGVLTPVVLTIRFTIASTDGRNRIERWFACRTVPLAVGSALATVTTTSLYAKPSLA